MKNVKFKVKDRESGTTPTFTISINVETASTNPRDHEFKKDLEELFYTEIEKNMKRIQQSEPLKDIMTVLTNE